jgi:predicted transcriptional regulator
MLKELKSQHRNIVQMSFNGYSNNEIAERLGMAHTTVSSILRSPLGQAYLHGLQDRAHEATLDVRKKLVSLNRAALDTFEHLLDSRSRKAVPAAVQFNAARDVLDRNGYKAPDRLSVDMTFQTKTDEELDAEIAAIEASINKTHGKNLPEIKKSLKSTLTESTAQTLSSPKPFTVVPSFTDSKIEDDLTLEDLFTDDNDQSDLFSETDFEEPILVEDPTVLEDLSFDPFHNIKRP